MSDHVNTMFIEWTSTPSRAECECHSKRYDDDFCPKHQPRPYSYWSARHRGRPQPMRDVRNDPR